MIYSDELLVAAKRIFWFGTPEEALEFPKRFLTYAMKYASDEDIASSVALKSERYKGTPVPPLPKRKIPGVDPATIPDFFPPKY
jgi:hypothetical protein